MCRTANGYDINWEPTWKEAIDKLCNSNSEDIEVLESPRQKDGRGNIAPFTQILPTIAMEAKLKVDKKPRKMSEYELQRQNAYVEQFMQDLDGYIDNAKDCLIERFEWICSQPMESARFMYENGNMAGYIPEEGIRSALKHGTLAIGQLGLAEALQILIGCDHTTKAGMDLAKRIEQLFKDRCAEFKKEIHYVKPNKDAIREIMIKNIKEQKGEITEEDIKSIDTYCTSYFKDKDE